MPLLKVIAAIVLCIILGALGYIFSHLRKIKRELIANEAMPQPAPRATFLVFVSVVLVALISLLTVFLFSH